MGSIAISKVKDFLINGVQAISISSSCLYVDTENAGRAIDSWSVRFSSPQRKDTLPETNSSPLKMVVSNRNLLFQGSIFRCYVRECTSITIYKPCWFILDTSITKNFPNLVGLC